MDRHILALNPGSFTLKFGLYRISDSDAPRIRLAVAEAIGIIDRFGLPEAELRLEINGSPQSAIAETLGTTAESVETIIRIFTTSSSRMPSVDAIGCRVVHGGDLYTDPTRVNPEVLAGIRSLSPLAPLHNPIAADVLDACLDRKSVV